MRQKRIAVVNDLSGFGRCSVSVAQPIISAMKIQCCALPTSIFSAHTAFPGYFMDDFTDKMRPYMENWKNLGIEFDGIATGFLGSEEQIDIVIDFIKDFRLPHTKVLIDPVMGDYGIIYKSYTDSLCKAMQRMLPYGDILTPNLTEACRLLDIPYPEQTPSLESLEEIAVNLSQHGPSQIVITGLQQEDQILNFIYEKGKAPHVIPVEKIGVDRSGTGDVFSSVLIGALVNGKTLTEAVQQAASYISKTIAFTHSLDIPPFDGLCIEEYLHELAEQ